MAIIQNRLVFFVDFLEIVLYFFFDIDWKMNKQCH